MFLPWLPVVADVVAVVWVEQAGLAGTDHDDHDLGDLGDPGDQGRVEDGGDLDQEDPASCGQACVPGGDQGEESSPSLETASSRDQAALVSPEFLASSEAFLVSSQLSETLKHRVLI